MIQKIDGRVIAERIKDEIAQNIFALKGAHPNLAIILVGGRSDSELYVSLKEREGKKVGIDTHLYRLEAETSTEEITTVIDFLNQDELIDGILVQLPLPEHIDTDKVIAAIDPYKDADGFCPGHPDYILSPVLASILACLTEIKFDATGKSARILYNSKIFGLSIKKILEDKGLAVDLSGQPEDGDLLVSALGSPHKIKKDMVKEGAVIIDIGITKNDKGVFGDVDYEDVQEKAAFITPVPGGIGPLTIAFLFDNVWKIFKHRHKI